MLQRILEYNAADNSPIWLVYRWKWHQIDGESSVGNFWSFWNFAEFLSLSKYFGNNKNYSKPLIEWDTWLSKLKISVL